MSSLASAVLAVSILASSVLSQSAPDIGGGHVIVFTNVKVVPMTTETVVPNRTVVVREGKITQVIPDSEYRRQEGAEVIDARGAYLMPGLADMHVHLYGGWPTHPLHMYLANGVTTVRDLGGSPMMRRWRMDVRKGRRAGPRIYGTARTILGTEKKPRSLVPKHYRQGFRSQKVYSFLRRSDFRAVMKQIKDLGMYSVGHIPLAVGLEEAIGAGMEEVAHADQLCMASIEVDRDDRRLQSRRPGLSYLMQTLGRTYRSREVINDSRARATMASIAKKIKAANLAVCTTMATNELVADKVNRPQSLKSRSYAAYFPDRLRRAIKSKKDPHARMMRGHEREMRILRDLCQLVVEELRRAGAFLILGTDAGGPQLGTVPGFSIHDELRLLVRCGYTPYEAICMGTKNAAAVITRMHETANFGTVEAGRAADLVLLDANPLDDVRNPEKVRGVMAAGRWYPKERLQQLIKL